MLHSNEQRSYYEILLISPDANREEIDRACLNLWYRYQSLSTTPLWKDLSKQIDTIHATLLDPKARSAYDKRLHALQSTGLPGRRPELESNGKAQTVVNNFTYAEFFAIGLLYTLTVIYGKAPYGVGLGSVVAFNKLLDWMVPENWFDIMTIGGLVLFFFLATMGLCRCAMHLIRIRRHGFVA